MLFTQWSLAHCALQNYRIEKFEMWTSVQNTTFISVGGGGKQWYLKNIVSIYNVHPIVDRTSSKSLFIATLVDAEK